MPEVTARSLDTEHDAVRRPAVRPRLHVVGEAAPRGATRADERRTVQVRAGRHAPPARRRRRASAVTGAVGPDRLALWAVGLGVFMAFMAAVTAGA